MIYKTWLTATLVGLLPLAAYAQVSTPAQRPDRVIYDAAYYAPFTPRTALDMISQTPGFTLDDDADEEERRGFSGAVGNVLIDGQRLSAKSQSLTDVLQRVTASEVVRIEILRGSAVAGDASNAAVLANVVRTRNAGSGSWEAGAEVTNRDRPMPAGRLGWSGRNDALEYSIGANGYSHDHASPGRRTVRDGEGTLIARRFDEIPHENSEYALNGQVAFPAAGGRLTLTGQAAYARFEDAASLLTLSPAGAQLENELNPVLDRTKSAEAGVTYLRPVGAWSMELVGLATRKHAIADIRSTHFDADDVQDSEFTQAIDRKSGESIVRATFTRPLTSGRLELGGEIAVNTLDGELDLALDTGAGPVPVAVPNANLSVKENRGEAFASHVWPLSAQWSLDSRLAVETSRLRFSGDTDQSVSLTYVKPRVQLTRELGKHQLQMRVFRDVGQLDFTDFVSSAELDDDVINSGNPDLKPQTAWAAELEADLRFTGDAALRVRAFRHWLDDVVDLVPVGPPGAQLDAPGNIGAGSILGTEVSLRMSLGPLLRGGTLNIAGTWQDATVTDPVTGVARGIGDFADRHVKVDLRQDLSAAKLAWGIGFYGEATAADYRLAEIDRFRQLRMLTGFIETTVFSGFKLRFTAENLNRDTERRERRFYTPDRNGTLAERQVGYFRPGMWWSLTLSGSF